VALRLGLLYGPGTGNDEPARGFRSFGATLWIEDACSAFAAALDVPGGIYNVVSDGERVSNKRFQEATGWRPEHQPAASRP
jgi:nucleoside-diphosphate-sugar epimerase